MNAPLYIHLLPLPYLSWAYAYFFCNLLTPKKQRPHSTRMLFIFGCLLLPLIGILGVLHNIAGTNLLHFYFVVTAILFFKEKLWIKVSCYIIFVTIATLVEVCSCSVFLLIQDFIFHVHITALEINQITKMSDILLMSFINILIGILVFWKLTLLLKRCIAFLNAKIVLLVMFPILTAILSHISAIRAGNYHSVFLAALYWLLCLCSYPAFLLGLSEIRKAEKNRLLKENQLKLVKEQIELSQKMETEYTELRKWNHDVENHLFSLSYLLDKEKYADADAYQSTMMENLS